MKKFVAALVISSFFAGSAFAATVKPAPKAAPEPENSTITNSNNITTYTQLQSEANYPGALVRGSVTGTNIFVSDLPLLANSLIGDSSSASGFFTLKTDLGVFSLSVQPAVEPDLMGIALNPKVPFALNNNIYGLGYETRLWDMPFGATLQYGTDRSNYNSSDLTKSDPSSVFYLPGSQITSHTLQYLSGRIGTSMKSNMPLDLSLGTALYNNIDTYERYTPTGVAPLPLNSYVWNETLTYDQYKLAIDLAARLDLGNGFTTFAKLNWVNGKDVTHRQTVDNDYQTVYENSQLSLQALVGKDVKLGETLFLKIASGLNLSGNNSPKNYEQDFLWYTGEAVYYTFDYDTHSNFNIPINIALEGKLNDTWSFNTGWNYTLLNLDGDSTGANVADYVADPRYRVYTEKNGQQVNPTIAWAFGVTGRFGDLRIDTYFDPSLQIFTGGPHFISGAVIGDLNSGVALVYEWK